MTAVTVQKTVVDPNTGEEIDYTFTSKAETEEEAMSMACIYASMVDYGKYVPTNMAFPREQLYQFIQPNILRNIESMYEDAVPTAYANALAYVQSYIGAMYDVKSALASGDTTSTAMTLRLALTIATVTYILAASPQYAETLEMHNRQLGNLLRGLKSGSRNFGKEAVIGEPDVRATVVTLVRTGAKP